MKKLTRMKIKYSWKGVLISVVISILLIMLLLAGILKINSISREQELELTKQAIRKAVIQCYAIEGMYPAQLSYLEDNYYLNIDSEHYYVVYNSFSSNIMPEIEVFMK